MRPFLFIALAAALAVGCSKPDTTSSTTTGSTAATGKYAEVQAIFTASCAKCHSGARPKYGMDLTSYDGVMKGGTEGPVVKAGDAAGSKLVLALRGQGGAKQMPPKSSIPAADIAKIEAWITDGAKNG